MNELIPSEDKYLAVIDAQTAQIRNMAQLIQNMYGELNAVKKELRRLVKVTPMQARELNAKIRKRAKELCEQYKLPEQCEHNINTWLRAAVKDEFGTAVKDLPAIEFDTAKQVVKMWDEYAKLMALKARKG